MDHIDIRGAERSVNTEDKLRTRVLVADQIQVLVPSVWLTVWVFIFH